MQYNISFVYDGWAFSSEKHGLWKESKNQKPGKKLPRAHQRRRECKLGSLRNASVLQK